MYLLSTNLLAMFTGLLCICRDGLIGLDFTTLHNRNLVTHPCTTYKIVGQPKIKIKKEMTSQPMHRDEQGQPILKQLKMEVFCQGMEHHDELLDKLWDDGMTNYGTVEGKKKVAFAIHNTGMTAKQVKRWIDNRRRKYHRTDAKQRAFPLRRRKQSGYNVFMKQYICSKGGSVDKAEIMKSGAETWQGLDAEQRRSYQDEANEYHSQRLVTSTLGGLGFNNFTKKLGSEVTNMCAQVEGLEWVLVCSSAGLGASAVFGSTVGVNFTTSTNFAAKLCAASGHTGTGDHVYHKKSTAEETIKLRNEVQQIFNKKYSNATHTKKQMSYKLLEAGQVHCTGLPPGITLKRPSAYGRDVLKRIIAAEAEFKFTVSAQSSTSGSGSGSTDTGNTSGDVTANDQQAVVDEIETPQDMADLKTMVTQNRESDVYYAVEHLTEMKITGGKTYYRVKWDGFEDQTWEPAVNIPSKLRAEFNKRRSCYL